jgi:WD40 repeat protein
VLASGSADQTVRTWDVATAKTIRTFTGHVGPVYALAISPDGKTLASGGKDKTIRLWDMTVRP